MSPAVARHEVGGAQHWLGRHFQGCQHQLCIKKKQRVGRALPLGNFPWGFPSGADLWQIPQALDQVKVIDGQRVQRNVALFFSYFAIIQNKLYWVTRDTQTKEETTTCWFQRATGNCYSRQLTIIRWLGTWGKIKHNRLMARFYWLGICGIVHWW